MQIFLLIPVIKSLKYEILEKKINFYNKEVPRLSANEVADKIVCKARGFSAFYLMILRNSRISSISLSAIGSHLAVAFSIAQSISSLIACPRADLTAESCWMISRTPSSSSIICITPRSCHSIRRSLFVTRFFWSRSLIFTVL